VEDQTRLPCPTPQNPYSDTHGRRMVPTYIDSPMDPFLAPMDRPKRSYPWPRPHKPTPLLHVSYVSKWNFCTRNVTKSWPAIQIYSWATLRRNLLSSLTSRWRLTCKIGSTYGSHSSYPASTQQKTYQSMEFEPCPRTFCPPPLPLFRRHRTARPRIRERRALPQPAYRSRSLRSFFAPNPRPSSSP
jgi:hypothetical protein